MLAKCHMLFCFACINSLTLYNNYMTRVYYYLHIPIRNVKQRGRLIQPSLHS